MKFAHRDLQKIATQLKIDVLSMITKAGTGHPAGSLGMTDVFVALYFGLLKQRPQQADWSDRDYVLLSNGHICPIWYATLAYAGYFPKEKLLSLRQINSPLQGHPHIHELPGIENTAGPLGQGISQACGLALGLKMDQKPNKVYCLMSDGEQQEGQVWEAYMLAAKYKLNNLITLIDRNHIQISGKTEQVMPLQNLKQKIASFGWQVMEIDGHNFGAIEKAVKKAWKSKHQPTAIICRTIPGKGVSFMENQAQWHGKAPSHDQLAQAIKELEAHVK